VGHSLSPTRNEGEDVGGVDERNGEHEPQCHRNPPQASRRRGAPQAEPEAEHGYVAEGLGKRGYQEVAVAEQRPNGHEDVAEAGLPIEDVLAALQGTGGEDVLGL
jgi:hypothetical protein